MPVFTDSPSLFDWHAGLEDIDFWDDVGGSDGLEDPLMQAVEAAMGCTDESEISCFHMATPEV